MSRDQVLRFAAGPEQTPGGDVARVATPYDRLDDWLLHGPAQLRSGPHAGGVVGTLPENTDARYVYPEITGYFLQWLAWHARLHGRSARHVAAATAAQAWLGRWIEATSPPLTRVYLEPAPDDWRNDANFTFDLGMALRGVAAAVDAGLAPPTPELVRGFDRELSGMIGSDGLLDACRATRGALLPDRWSTRRGPFLAKPAAGILFAGRIFPALSARLLEAARATLRESLRWHLDAPHREIHALLYGFEGWLGATAVEGVVAQLRASCPLIAAMVQEVLVSGRICEVRDQYDGPQRADVLAQLLRVGDRLQAHGCAVFDGRTHATFRARLLAGQLPDGSMPFALADGPRYTNLWASMFASQALASVPIDVAASTDDVLLV